jgi:anaerobic selenocysteine-containing dehydrogenase
MSRELEQWAVLADVPVSQLEETARLYARRPASILVGWGLQRRRFGATTVRSIDALAAISGNLGIAGGGVSFCFPRRSAFDLTFGDAQPAPRTIPEPLLGPGILAQRDPPIRMAWVTAANPVAMLPESQTVRQALESRELTVVVDAFLTDTARTADIVLPTTTFLEEDDLLGAYGHHWLAEMQPVVKPPANVKSDYQIVQELAARVGLQDRFAGSTTDWKQRMLAKLDDHGVDLPRLRHGAVKNPLATQVLFSDRRFATPSGRVNLLHRLPSELTEATKPAPLRLAALSTSEAQSSQWIVETQHGPPTATVHPKAAPGHREGHVVLLRSAIGSMEVVLRFDARQRADLVLMDKGGWLQAGRCANALVKAELTDDGECAVYYDTPVQIVGT